MHGRKRTSKKHLKQAGWRIAEDGRTEGGYRLVLEKPAGERVTVEAPSRPRAYAKAERQLKA